ncbi:MAG: hypothetical protein WDN08_12145 [Rhizomicrobium sp.]
MTVKRPPEPFGQTIEIARAMADRVQADERRAVAAPRHRQPGSGDIQRHPARRAILHRHCRLHCDVDIT